MSEDTGPSLGLLIGLPAGLLAMFITGSLALYALHRWRTEDQYGGYHIVAAIAGAGWLGALVITGITMWPWSYEYHSWRNVDGQVAEVSSRLISAGDKGGSNQKFVVRFTDGRVRGVQDTRAALLKPGDQLTVRCKRAWQFSGTDGWDCNWVDSTPTGTAGGEK